MSEPQFINLSYVQAQHDYLAGNYPVVREDAAQVRHCSWSSGWLCGALLTMLCTATLQRDCQC